MEWFSDVVWWWGATTMIVFACWGVAGLADWALTKVLRTAKVYVAFLQWVADRAKRRKPTIPG